MYDSGLNIIVKIRFHVMSAEYTVINTTDLSHMTKKKSKYSFIFK